MQTITPAQNKRLHQLLNQTGLKEEKAFLIAEFSHKGSQSSRELLSSEAQSLIRHLESKLDIAPGPTLNVNTQLKGKELAEACDKMRKKVIHYAYEMKWTNTQGKIDMERINAWCKHKGKFKKELNQHSHDELAQLVSQFEIVYKSFLSNLVS